MSDYHERERPDLPGDEWKRDPERGSQPDHVQPFIPGWPRNQVSAVVLCPKCLAMNKAPAEYDRRTGLQLQPRERRLGRNVSVALNRSMWCVDCDEWLSPPMSYEQAMAYFEAA